MLKNEGESFCNRVVAFALERIGLVLRDVSEVLRVTDDEIRPALTGEAGMIEALCARGREFVSLLELARVLRVDGSH